LVYQGVPEAGVPELAALVYELTGLRWPGMDPKERRKMAPRIPPHPYPKVRVLYT
jgi:hypothetical protein